MGLSIQTGKLGAYFGKDTRFRPLRDNLVIKVLPLKLSQTLIADWNGYAARGQVIAAGKGHHPIVYQSGTKDGKLYKTMHDSTRFRPIEVKVGDIVQVGSVYAFTVIYVNHDQHIICSERDIALIEE